jgi:Ca2+-binding RTX toxin-like protein
VGRRVLGWCARCIGRDITVTASPDAIHAYGIVVANSPGAGITYQQQFPGFDIVPRLPDGQLLTSDHVIVSADTIAREIHGSDADQLIYETGPGNVTIIGGAGINLLYAGSGSDTLVGGPNRDYLFGGSGSDRFSAGAGSNYLEAGSGAAVFVLAASDAAQDLIADFKPAIDRMVVTDPTGVHASATEIGSYIAGATADSSGAAVLHLSANHDVTLQGIAVGQLSASLFG